jgi:hypothetical protein
MLAVPLPCQHQPPLPSEHRAQWFAAALLVIGPVSLAGILLQNAAVILLPGWSRLTARRGTATALGTNLANSALTILLLILLLIVPCALGFGIWRAGGGDAWLLLVCAGVIGLALGAECWGMVRWLGMRFEQMDAMTRAALN